MTDNHSDPLERQTDKTSAKDVVRVDRAGQDAASTSPAMHSQQDRENYRRELELQLQKIRSQASAARLEAEAAEIELMIRRLSSEASLVEHFQSGELPAIRAAISDLPVEMGARLELGPPRFHHWNDVRRVMNLRIDEPPVPPTSITSDPSTWTRIDSAHTVPRHHFEADPASEAPRESAADDSSAEFEDAAVSTRGAPEMHVPQALTVAPMLGFEQFDTATHRDASLDAELELDDEEIPQRTRPGAWLLSLLVHVAILILLATIGLTQHRPKDQVALTASPTSAEQVSMETFELEASEPQTEPQPSEPITSEVQYDLSPVGEVSAAEMISQAPSSPASSSVSAMLSRSTSAATSMSMKPNSEATMEFCGVKGGGNHFVYLVDSSGSMGDAFDSARAELLRSIDLLKPEQRFYVVFFDAQSDYMRLEDPNVDEPRSVNATRANRDALKRWAMRINKDRGSAPYDALRFALKLKPDVIFLLSDGEFPQGIEDLLKQENRVVNLFGDDDPICIVHTIGYHSKEGESRMKRIAEQNQGMYRHVPEP